ncbi:hypothetical protein DM860_014953 [Cuscuta australis]|uniref:RING-type E3 ubiquitin transferase n=1 Tax=Cuscuta australis TaxID=267555 RepID=A0A328E3X5_9ASTE|nr:hypothetical protein DM860_014953 [Cuscuta australis]
MSMKAAPPPSQYVSPPPITLLLIAFLLVFFFLGIFFVIFCKYCIQSLWHNRVQAGSPVGPEGHGDMLGIDPKIVESFPAFSYSSVKDYRKEKYGLECAICLVEFEDESVLRLLTSCNHVFHQECIDLWMESHKTCPVCRQALDSPVKYTPYSPALSLGNGPDENFQEDERMACDMHSIIDIHDREGDVGNNEGVEAEEDEAKRVGVENRSDQRENISLTKHVVTLNHENADNNDDEEDEKSGEEKYPRSHSTGHSIVKIREDEDRFTLRLPLHVRAKIIRGHNATKSCTTFGERKKRKPTEENIISGFSQV